MFSYVISQHAKSTMSGKRIRKQIDFDTKRELLAANFESADLLPMNFRFKGRHSKFI